MESPLTPARVKNSPATIAPSWLNAPYLPVILCLVLLYSLSQFDHGLWTPDEPRVAAIAHEVTHGAWVIPTLNGSPFLEEPPLHAWMVAGVYRRFGHTEPAIGRLISALFGLGGLFLTFLLARQLCREAGESSKSMGLYAALTLGLSLEYFAIGHRLVVDGALAFFTTAAALFYYQAISSPGVTRQIAWSAAAALAAALAFMTKGLVGLAVPLLLICSVAMVTRSLQPIRRAQLWLLPLALLIIAGPWLTLAFQQLGGESFQTLFIENTFWRVLPPAQYTGGHRQPSYYYLSRLIPHLGPAAALVIAGIVRRFRHKAAADQATDLALTWFGLGFVLLTLAGTKRAVYLLPFFPALAVVGGIWLQSVIHNNLRSSLDRLAFCLLGLALAAAGSTPLLIQLGIRAGFVPSDAPVAPLGSVSIAGTLVMALVSFAAGALTVRQAIGLRPGPALACLITGFLVCMILARSTLVPVVDQEKNLEVVSRRIARLVPRNAPLVLLGPDETTLAMVSLYMDRRAELARSTTELSEIFGEHPTVFLLVLDKQKAQSNFERVQPLRGVLLLKEGRTNERVYSLFRMDGGSATKKPPLGYGVR